MNKKLTKKVIVKQIGYNKKTKKNYYYKNSDNIIKCYFHCFSGTDKKENIANYIYLNQTELNNTYNNMFL